MKIKMIAALLLIVGLGVYAADGVLVFEDPTGDDFGPGNYTYPTDAVYTKGSFDLTKLEVKYTNKKMDFKVDLATKLEDPWGMGVGFAVQMIFVFIDTDGKPGSGHTDGLPGLNVKFEDGSAWDKVVILSPQQKSRVTNEAEMKAESFMDDILVPSRTRGKSRSISGSIKIADIGDGDPATWGYQVVVQSNEGFPGETDLLTRKVNEWEGQHRFGGGNDMDCDPHVMDILAGSAAGGSDEIEAQKKMLAYECDDEGNAKSHATLAMIRKK